VAVSIVVLQMYIVKEVARITSLKCDLS